MGRTSYTSANRFPGLREILYLFRAHRDPSRVYRLMRDFDQLRHKMESLSGETPESKSVLDIGPGPFLIQSLLFASLGNKVTAMDLDVIPLGLDIGAYIRMLRTNGIGRAAKTVARKILGIDSAYRKTLAHELGARRFPHIRILQGDATSMSFEDCQFDIVHCNSVLHHVLNPAAALAEMVRVVRPGGLAYASLHCYTSYNGSLDPRVMTENPNENLYWGHLRNSLRGVTAGNAVLNKLRVHEWKELFETIWPGCELQTVNSQRSGIGGMAESFISSGDIQGYTVEELLCHHIDVLWQKPK